MCLRIIIAVCVVFAVCIEAVPNIQETQIMSTNRQRDMLCDFYPQIKCSSDCSSLTVCHDEASLPLSLKCPANRPHCANGKCGSVNGCETKPKIAANVQSFVCTADDIFPDPSNCTNYYVCNGSTATQISCNPGYIFDSKLNLCARGTPRVDHASKKICQKISCDNKPNGYILFPANPAFYAYCVNNSTILYKCDDVENEMFEMVSQKCVFKCKSAGYFPDPSNCTVYYLCKGLIKLKSKTLYCASGHYFDGMSMSCVEGENCGVTTVPPTEEPSTTTEEPTTTTEEPTTTTEEPTTTTEEPTTTTEEPTTTTEEPSTPPIGGITSIPYEKLAAPPSAVTIKDSSTLPIQSLWIHKGKYSYRLGKSL